jgi:Fe-S-cluster-containing hydrogenase component 2
MQTADTLFVDVDRCSGCGVCVGVCPNGAMSIQDGKACITQALCNQCEACGDSCPEGAILSVTEQSLVRSEGQSAVVEQQSASVQGTGVARAAPAIGAALLFIGREVVPRVVDRLFDAVEGKLSESSLRSTGDGSRSGESGAGSRRRRRHRGG